MPQFSWLRTHISDRDCLIAALEQLGMRVVFNADVRGLEGGRTPCEIVGVRQGACDIGFRMGDTGCYDIVADLYGLSLEGKVSNIIKNILQTYADLGGHSQPH
jgi:hypothetical protein